MGKIVNLAKLCQEFFGETANNLSITTGFIKRQRKITGSAFLKAIVLGNMSDSNCSLDGMRNFLSEETIDISAQGLDFRFTEVAVKFMQSMYEQCLKLFRNTMPLDCNILQQFNSVKSLLGIFPAACGVIWRNEQMIYTKVIMLRYCCITLVFPAKYCRAVFDVSVDQVLREICLEMEKRYQIKFLEIGVDEDHVHFLVQSVPTYSVTKIVTTIKSVTARQIFRQSPQVKKQLWGGEFWTDGYFTSTVGKHGNENMIGKYVKNQGKEYKKLHEDHQLAFF